MAGKGGKKRGPSRKAREAAARKRQLLQLARGAEKTFDMGTRALAYGHGAFQLAEPYADVVPFVMNQDWQGARETARVATQQAMTKRNMAEAFGPIIGVELLIGAKGLAKGIARFASRK